MRLASLVFIATVLCLGAVPILAADNPPAATRVHLVVDSAKLEAFRNSETASHLHKVGEELRLLVEARVKGLPAPTLTTDSGKTFDKNGFTAARLGVSQLNFFLAGGGQAPIAACVDPARLSSSQTMFSAATTEMLER